MSNKSNNCKKPCNIPNDLIRIILGSPRPSNYKYKPSSQSLIFENKDDDRSSHSLIFEDGGKDENKLSFSGDSDEFVATGNPSEQQQPCKRCTQGSSYKHGHASWCCRSNAYSSPTTTTTTTTTTDNVLTMDTPESPTRTGTTKKNFDKVRLEFGFTNVNTTKLEPHEHRTQNWWEIRHNKRVSKGKNKINENKQKKLETKKNNLISTAISNLNNHYKEDLKNKSELTLVQKSEYEDFINIQWKRTKDTESLNSFLKDIGLDEIYNNTSIMNTGQSSCKDELLSITEKENINIEINKYLVDRKDKRVPISNNKQSWTAMKDFFDEAELVLKSKRKTDTEKLYNKRINEAFKPFYIPQFRKKYKKKLVKKVITNLKGDDNGNLNNKNDPKWIKKCEDEIKQLTKTAEKIYKEIGRTPPRDSWEDKIEFKNKMQMCLACICTGNEKDESMTRAVRALQMFDMFNYNFFVNASLEDMKRMQYLLLYVGMNKARERPATMIGTCKIIDTIFNGRLPDTIDDWMGFHNVARKLAALIMNDALGFVYFLVVDTHLKQVLPKIGWTEKTKPDDIAIDIEGWLDRMLLKETNETIVGIRQLYKYSSISEKTIIIQFIVKYSKTKPSDLLVGLL